jgi:hypothetical protein
MSTERIIVHQSIAAEFESALREAISTIQDRQFDLIRPSAVNELKALVDDATTGVSPPKPPHLTSRALDSLLADLSLRKLHPRLSS